MSIDCALWLDPAFLPDTPFRGLLPVVRPVIESGAKLVPLLASGLQIEQQVLDVEPQFCECFLNQF